MRSRRRLALSAGLLAAAVGCGGPADLSLPGTISTPKPPTNAGLFAGFGRTDITPPVGVPMAGHGFEGLQAEGYRQRLYARAIALEAADGERLLLLVADLPHASLVLHRRVAAAIHARTGIGADRLMLAATHTHSGPGNHYAAAQYNAQAGPLTGFDEALTDFLVAQMADAAEEAVADLGPAVAGWGQAEVAGVTRNRSLDAYARNPGFGGGPASEAVDDTLRMLRVDRCDAGWVNCRPEGVFSTLAIHGTTNPAANAFLDADVHGVVERELEAHMVSVGSASPDPVHLFANGAAGDVSPTFPADTRCEVHRNLTPGGSRGGPRGLEGAETWRWDQDELAQCLEDARVALSRIGSQIAAAAQQLYASIEQSGRLTRSVPIGRAFRTVDLAQGLCEPRAGVSTLGGAEDARTRLHRWRLLGIDLAMQEGGSAARSSASGCHGHKRIAVQPLQGLIVGDRGFPTHTQLSVLRIGGGLLATVPGEPTTAVGLDIRRTILASDPTATIASVVGLANGYIQYVTTPEEYAAQHYEGGSTLYGPRTAEVLTNELDALASALRSGIDVADAPDLIVGPGRARSYMPTAAQGPAPGTFTREVITLTCDGSRVRGAWLDLHPGRFGTHEGSVLRFERLDAGAWRRIAEDDELDVWVRAERSRGGRGYEWSAVWRPIQGLPSGTYRLVLSARGGMPEVAGSPTVDCP